MTAVPRVLIFVQHLRGIGHLQRAAAIARELANGGIAVDLVSGGMPVSEIDVSGIGVHQLPPVRSPDDSYTRLVDEHGAPAGPALRAARQRRLVDLVQAVRPHAVIVEMFPFGRSQIAHEIIALIEAARALSPRSLMISSVRDIVAQKRSTERYVEMAEQAAAWFDAVLVHGDPAVLPFDESFPAVDMIRDRVHYTGYVLANRPPPRRRRRDRDAGEVLVTAGGGAFGGALMRAAVAARAHKLLDRDLASRPWRLITGPNLPAAEARALDRHGGDGVVIEPFCAELPARLAGARLSVSLCGYNTALEVAAAGVPAVMVPAGSGRQNEQRRRAQAFARMGLAEVLAEDVLDGASLAAAMNRAAAAGRGPRVGRALIDMSGGETSCRLVADWLAKEAASRTPALPSSA
ncbi:MAG: glycosyltransferase [Alphaproteobacteria bacterium]|nr:glycosyltransferase [Alphaproteobacteria bacterium]